MGIKEIARNLLSNFFSLFSCIILGMLAYLRIIGVDLVDLRSIFAIFVMSVLQTLTTFVFYSKSELKRGELLFRYLIQILVVIVISLIAASYMRWVLWSEPASVVMFTGFVVGIYIVTLAVEYYQSKKLADKLYEKLKERYR